MLVTAASLILKYYWDDFSISAKLCVAIFPLLAAVVFGIIVLKKDFKTCWREAAAAIFPASVALMLSLIANAYRYEGEELPFLAAAGTSAIIAAFAFRSALGCAIAAALATSIIDNSNTVWCEAGYLIFAICLTIASGAVLLGVYKSGGFFNYVCAAAFLLFSEIGLCGLLPHFPEYSAPADLLNLSAISAVLFLLNRGQKAESFFKTPVFIAALIGFFIVAGNMICDAKFLFEKSLFCIKDIPALNLAIAFSVPALCLAAYAAMAFSKIKRGCKGCGGALLLSLIFPLFAIMAAFRAGAATSAVLANLLMFFAGAAFVFKGLKNRDFFEMNIGVFVFAMQAIFRIASTDSILAKAAFFFAAGIVLVVFNKILIARKAL